MKKTFLHALTLFALLLPTGLVQAEPPAHCIAQARELALRAGNDIFPDMTAAQRSELLQLSAEICARHPAKATADAAAAADEDRDWFSDYVIEGEPANKAGNRRLERRRRQ